LGDAGEVGEVAQPDACPFLVAGGPALDARDRQAGGVLPHVEQVSPAQNDRRADASGEREPPGRSRFRFGDPGARRGLVDLEIIGAADVLAVRREQRDPPQRPAEGLADGQQRDEGRPRAGEGEDAAPGDRGLGGCHGDQVSGLRRLGACPGQVCAQFRDEAAAAQRLDHRGQLYCRVDDEAGDEYPRAVEVQRVEGSGELVPRLDVQDPGRELEDGPADEQQQRQPFEGVRG
jgi:hypothetical protein